MYDILTWIYIIVALAIVLFIGTIVNIFNKSKFEGDVLRVLHKTRNMDRFPCQSVSGEYADRAVTFIRITGLVLAMRWEQKTMFLSKKGYFIELIKVLLYNLLFGWWGIKSFICNIGAIGNNLSTLFMYTKLDKLKQEVKTMKAKSGSSSYKLKESINKQDMYDSNTGKIKKGVKSKPLDDSSDSNTRLALIGLILSFVLGFVGFFVCLYAKTKIDKEIEPNKNAKLMVNIGLIWGGIQLFIFIIGISFILLGSIMS
jgi:hypothetical protein